MSIAGANQSYDLDYLTTDSGNARVLVDRHYHDLKYCEPLGGWLVWSGMHWKVDNNAVWHRAEQLGRDVLAEAINESDRTTADRLWKHGRYTLKESGLRAMISLAARDPRVSRNPNDFDTQPYLLNFLNGTVDLSTGKIAEHDRNQLLTKLITHEYDPNAEAPTWDSFLQRVLPDEELREYIQKAVGYSVIGEVNEHVLLILYGTGRNGKGTFVETIRAAAREYVHRTRTDMLMIKAAGNGPSPDMANLKGKRFVFASESEDGQRLAESTIKDLTGGDTINARHLNRDPMEFEPTHTLWLQTNHRPMVRGSDIGIWSRLKLLPFTEFIPQQEQDPKLKQKLQAELPGILAWIVRGAWLYQNDNGLRDEPEAVRIATQQYRDDMDKITQFLADECVIGPQYSVSKSALYKAYQQWCEDSGMHAESKNKFGHRLLEKESYSEHRSTGGLRLWVGVGLRSSDTGDTGDADSWLSS